MTKKQRIFVEHFLQSGDGGQALRAAGYPPAWTLERLLNVPAVRDSICGRVVADKEEVAAFFSNVMRGKPAADERLPGVKEQLKAAELLAKHFGMFTERDKAGQNEAIEFTGDERLED